FVDDSAQSLTDELAKGPAVVTNRYQDYQQMIGNIPKTTRFFLIAGQLDETDLSDGTVPFNSAFPVYALMKQRANEKEEKEV
ncbi:alpha/beta hydrolase, partial [Enterococcus faecium]|uniref:alpha/beta hydrolase n=1 Tax=Enterococcus faecium TaxID=1352 RepID=UPI003CC5258E